MVSTDSEPQAPNSLDLVIDFVNTLDIDEGTDSIERPQTLATWLRERKLLGPGEALARAITRTRSGCARPCAR